jgi:hypothetical protein
MLTGGTISTAWGRTDGRAAWCHLSVWDLGGPSEHIGSYGGSVWPLAWPQWFVGLPSSAQLGSGRIALTDAGRKALLRSVEARGVLGAVL